MTDDLAVGQPVFVLKDTHQPLHAGQLSLTRLSLLKISDQTDTDPELVVFVIGTLGVSTVNLLAPAKCGLNFSVVHPLPVSDEKVIADAVPSTSNVSFVYTLN